MRAAPDISRRGCTGKTYVRKFFRISHIFKYGRIGRGPSGMVLDLSAVSVLVIDDNSHMRSLFRAILGGFGVRRIFDAVDGAEGFATTVDRKPDVVICDWVMSPLSGAEFLALLRADADMGVATTPVILASADARKPVVLEAVDLGIHEFLAKPLAPAMLYHRLQRVLTEHRPFLRSGGRLRPAPRGCTRASARPSPAVAAAALATPAARNTYFL